MTRTDDGRPAPSGGLLGYTPPGGWPPEGAPMRPGTTPQEIAERRVRDGMSEASDLAVLAGHFPDSQVARRGREWTAKAPDGTELVALGPGALAWQLLKAHHRPGAGS